MVQITCLYSLRSALRLLFVATYAASILSVDATSHISIRIAKEPEFLMSGYEKVAESIADFCWKDSYGRGVGKVPKSCPPGQTRIGLLCYPNCPAGYSRFGFDCHSDCPSDFRNDGLFCRKSEYGRGAGYPWKFGDSLNDSGMFKRCERDNGKGNCEKYGLIVYPKCKPGYNNFGCCICRPPVPNCNALGLNNGIDLSCAKRIIIGDPGLGVCAADEDRDAGLCYPKCRSGFNGVGPVCWGGSPSGWVDCGMGSARTSSACASAIKDQVLSVGELAVFVASLGTSSSAKALAAPAEASKVKKLKDAWNSIKNSQNIKKAKEAYDAANEVKGAIDDAQTVYTNLDTLMTKDNISTEDYIRMAAEISAILDPSGVSGIVAAYTYPKCDKITA